MPALNFKEQFVEPIRSGRKHHTIRAKRKNPIKVGDNLFLYCGMRTGNCFAILNDAQKCTKLQNIIIRDIGSAKFMFVDEETLMPDECERLAVADGFDSFKNMMEFWDGRLPFEGNIIHWK